MGMRMTYEERRQETFRLLVISGLKLIANLFIAHATKNLGGSEKMQVSNFSRQADEFYEDRDDG